MNKKDSGEQDASESFFDTKNMQYPVDSHRKLC